MPALTLHLLALAPRVQPENFVKELKRNPDVQVVFASRPRRLVISPTVLDLDPLLSEKWNLLVLLQALTPTEAVIPSPLLSFITAEYKLRVGIPSKLLNSYPERDAKLKAQAAGVPLTGTLDTLQAQDSSQNLEVSAELLGFMNELMKEHDKPVTMLNLLHFHHPDGKKNYFKYGQGFNPVASKRGGNAKLVGNVIRPASAVDSDSRGSHDRPEQEWWNEISIVHYPSIKHFCDMLASEDYQEVNRKHRLGALRDTLLLCTTEFDLEETSAKL